LDKSASIQAGKVTKVEIESKSGADCAIRIQNEDIRRFPTTKGQKIVLTPS